MSCVPPICPIRAGLVRDFDAAFHTIEPHGHSMREGVSRCLTAIFRIIVPEYAQSLYDGGRCESLEPISAAGGPARNAKIAGDRKSVVEGKSGSVRVGLGGRRIIKKKK